MNINEILSVCDHTLLKQEATWPDIQNLCDEARKYHTASVCIPPCFVADAHAYLGKDIPVCTVIGFPNGNMTTKTKLYETEDALKNGADEIDMVININMLKSNRTDYVLSEIKQLKSLRLFFNSYNYYFNYVSQSIKKTFLLFFFFQRKPLTDKHKVIMKVTF